MSLKIAILGTRGIPNNYGGFEQIAAYLAKGLVEKGHSVTVYNSHKHPYKENKWNGVNIIHCYDPEYLIGTPGQFIYDLNCIRDSRKKNYDIILMLGYTSSSVWRKLFPRNSTVIINMDGLEWKRSKYSIAVKKFLQYAEKLAMRSGNFFIADSKEIKNYLEKKYNIPARYIPYGAEITSQTNEDVITEYALSKYQYYLLMARMEPENNIELVLDGFRNTDVDKPFIVIGSTKNKYGKYLLDKYKDDARIRFIGGLFNKEKVAALTGSSCLYFHGHSVGGTNPSLLEAMAANALIGAHDNPFNRAILINDAFYFTDTISIKNIIYSTEKNRCETMIENNFAKIAADFNWPAVVGQYEQFFYECYAAHNGRTSKATIV